MIKFIYLTLLYTCCMFAQVSEDFSDDDFYKLIKKAPRMRGFHFTLLLLIVWLFFLFQILEHRNKNPVQASLNQLVQHGILQ